MCFPCHVFLFSTLSILPLIHALALLPSTAIPAFNDATQLLNTTLSSASPHLPPITYPNAACGYYTPPYRGTIFRGKNTDYVACQHALYNMLMEGVSLPGGKDQRRYWLGIPGQTKKVWEGRISGYPGTQCWASLIGRGPSGGAGRSVGTFSYADIDAAAQNVMKECISERVDPAKGRQKGLEVVPKGQIMEGEFMILLENRQNEHSPTAAAGWSSTTEWLDPITESIIHTAGSSPSSLCPGDGCAMA